MLINMYLCLMLDGSTNNMKKIIIITCILGSAFFIRNTKQSHTSNQPTTQKVFDLKEKIVNLVVEPVYAASACITNATLVVSVGFPCVSSVVVTPPEGCVFGHPSVYAYTGVCLFGTSCANNDGATITATLSAGCCNSIIVAIAHIDCYNGTMADINLIMPGGAKSATFRIIRSCPPCQLSVCISNIISCNNQ